MLKEILRIVGRDGYISKSLLARELSTSQEMVDKGLEQLVRMGYLVEQQTGEDCSVFCANCPFAKNCNKEVAKTFEIASKGDEILKK